MKKLLLLLVLFIGVSYAFAKDSPDPFYLNSPTLDYEQMKKQEKPKDNRTFNEKFREKLHLPKTKKIYYHNIDKSSQPVSIDDYNQMAQDKKRQNYEIPMPEFNQNTDFICPDPKFRVVMYNSPPGQRNIDVSHLISQRTATSAGILSPDKTKMIYTKCFFYPRFAQTATSAYLIPVNNKNVYDALYQTNVIEGDTKALFSVGMDYLKNGQFKTLFPLDWSKDSKKIAFKEKIGSNFENTWQTNIIVYDLTTKDWKRLTAVREAIVYWWQQNKQINLKDYMWDIFPLGWDKLNQDRLVLYAYAYTDENPMFLGTWSVDYNENKSELISIDSTDVQIDLNGFGLKEVKLEN